MLKLRVDQRIFSRLYILGYNYGAVYGIMQMLFFVIQNDSLRYEREKN